MLSKRPGTGVIDNTGPQKMELLYLGYALHFMFNDIWAYGNFVKFHTPTFPEILEPASEMREVSDKIFWQTVSDLREKCLAYRTPMRTA